MTAELSIVAAATIFTRYYYNHNVNENTVNDTTHTEKLLKIQQYEVETTKYCTSK